jgi:hypothetical protein
MISIFAALAFAAAFFTGFSTVSFAFRPAARVFFFVSSAVAEVPVRNIIQLSPDGIEISVQIKRTDSNSVPTHAVFMLWICQRQVFLVKTYGHFAMG